MKATIENVEKLLIKWGNNVDDVKKMISEHFDYAVSTYKNATAKEIALCVRSVY